ncbi:MAG TPA: galactose-1-phosphate uridylyltransferase [Deltaproteobacteria bacterium]|nr:MAG: galactose-1-phosphate uridylyltransferase [Deltaproteobacteria bacterium GWA2_55_82]OGQ63106.1 MAG: galactose-1-phosphate uridylyltransferase [Deltaproteobacteria bacterium RIFCSPLOWO2_02_FULL_55_12]OIJ73568.1 MAG: galactose-1-phosphate uridylyltransferase [Deltaproteobacteria bacterium GWC2_55_46]HBG47701.1 galactose-1-phosphate uridylyltransferase [Deltaproteobacteria bacterium]HCY12077.1 galactose-1-phosphate uridylyltransferase [Deltaproteobacteria bacterium]
MPELRKDPIVGRWVIISTERGKRPSEFEFTQPTVKAGFCPFCPGNEPKTPGEVLAYRKNGGAPNSSGWHVRVVPNKYPALKVEGDLNREGDGVYDKMNGVGAHEVIIESPVHTDTLSRISPSQFEEVLWAYRDRMIDLKKDQRLRYILIFKNHGEAAGATLEHSHSQLIALPIIPKRVAEELDGSLEYFNFKERCVFCDIIRQEIMQGHRVVSENRDFIAITPYAPKAPFELWILPKVHESSFENSQKHQYENLSLIFSDVLKRIDKVLNFPPYNFILHAAPIKDGASQFYHWHFELIPKLTKVAGFEWGSGFYINPTPPEEAAKFLREAKV